MFKKFFLGILASLSFMLAAVNINTASKEELTTLKGIGAQRAEAIIEYRNKNGKFQSIEELKKVKGIGDKIFESIKNDLTIGGIGTSKPKEQATKGQTTKEPQKEQKTTKSSTAKEPQKEQKAAKPQ